MPSSFGNTLRVSIFGQSHSAGIGCVVEGLPSGHHVDLDALAAFMARRAPGQGSWTTPRAEPDAVKVVAGLNVRGDTCGAPLALLIENTNTRSQDYDRLLTHPRPGHADWPAQAKWGGSQDVRGGGHFSGRPVRVTGPGMGEEPIIVLRAGVGVLYEQGKRCAAGVSPHIEPFAPLPGTVLDRQLEAVTAARPLTTIDSTVARRMAQAIDAARGDQDSVGGTIECVATGLPAGVGSPMFDGLENLLARALFGIPAIKGVEFGAGFAAARLCGSEDNDPWHTDGSEVMPTSNNAGGILGGLSTGAPIILRVAIKPTSSISRPQQTIDMARGKDDTVEVAGRHDPCIAPRAVPVVEATCALALLDAWLSFPPEHARRNA